MLNPQDPLTRKMFAQEAFVRLLRLDGPVPGRGPAAGPRAGAGGKILLGSDFPNIPYPYARQLAGLARLGLGADWLRAVCWDNPVALFGAQA